MGLGFQLSAISYQLSVFSYSLFTLSSYLLTQKPKVFAALARRPGTPQLGGLADHRQIERPWELLYAGWTAWWTSEEYRPESDGEPASRNAQKNEKRFKVQGIWYKRKGSKK